MHMDTAGGDPISALTARGAPFELMDVVVRGAPARVFRNAPQSLSQLFRAAREHQARVFAVSEGVRLTYGEVFAAASALAAELGTRGVTKGTHVAIAMRNRPEWLIAFIAISALGAVPVLVNSRGAAPELVHSLTYTRCGYVVADDERAGLMVAEPALAGIEGVKVGESLPAPPRWRLYQDILARPDVGELPECICAPEDPAVIMFTSGTTGKAKGTVLDQRGLLTALLANQLSAAVGGVHLARRLGVDPDTLMTSGTQPCTLLVFPLFHTSGCLSVFLANLMRGGKIVFLPRWSAAAALQCVQAEHVSALPAVPTMLWDLLHAPERHRYDTSSLLSLGTGGQGLPVNLLRAIREAFPHAVLGTGYGMTETNGMVTMLMGEEYEAHPSSAGRPLPTAEVHILDDEGRRVPTGEVGEICVRSVQNMRGYWECPEADAERVREGWLLSGDLGRFDERGLLYIVSRKSDMVISGGENIYCAEVEHVLTMHPQVLEAVTFGVPDDRLGEKLVAAVVARPGADLEALTLSEFCKIHLAAYKVPREWRFDRGPLERNVTGKLMKSQVRRRLWGH